MIISISSGRHLLLPVFRLAQMLPFSQLPTVYLSRFGSMPKPNKHGVHIQSESVQFGFFLKENKLPTVYRTRSGSMPKPNKRAVYTQSESLEFESPLKMKETTTIAIFVPAVTFAMRISKENEKTSKNLENRDIRASRDNRGCALRKSAHDENRDIRASRDIRYANLQRK